MELKTGRDVRVPGKNTPGNGAILEHETFADRRRPRSSGAENTRTPWTFGRWAVSSSKV